MVLCRALGALNSCYVVVFSGAEGAWDAFDAIGSYIAGSVEIKSSDDTQIAFTMKLNRGSMGTTPYSGVYYYNDDNYGTDVIRMLYGSHYVTLTRTTAKPEAQETTESEAAGLATETATEPKRETIDNIA